MNASTTLRRTLLVMRLHLHRGWRRLRDRPRRLVLQVGVLVAVWAYIVIVGTEVPGATGTLQATGEIEPAEIREVTRGMVAALWLFHVGVAAKGTPTRAGSVAGGSFVLRSAGVRPVLWGTMLGEYARRLALFGVFAVATAVALLWGLGLPTRNPLVMFAVLLLFLTAEMVGMTLRLGVAASGVRLGEVGRVLLGGVALVVFSLALGYHELTLALLSRLPIAEFAEAFLIGVPNLPANAVAVTRVVVMSLIVLPILAVLIERFAGRTWFSGDERAGAGTDRTRVSAWLERLGVEGPTRAVAWRLWLQSRRKPMLLGLLGAPVLVVGLAVVEPEGTQTPLFPVAIGLYAVWMTGIVLTLNPLSSEDSTLPHLLSATGGEVVSGYALTAAVVGIPVTVATVLVGGLLIGPSSLILPALVVCVAVFLGTVPAGIALGLLLPRVEAIPVETDGPITPSKFAMAAHTLGIALLALPAVAVLSVAESIPGSLVLAGIALTVGCSLVVGVLSRGSAARRLDRLTLE